MPGAYHHHVGFNVWSSRGGPVREPGSRGLESYEVVLPDADALDSARDRLEAAGAPLDATDDGLLTADPSGNRLLLTRA